MGRRKNAIRPNGIGRVLRLVLVNACLLLPLETAAQQNPLIIRNDNGGRLIARLENLERLRKSKRPVHIVDGDCLSACTLYLGLSNLCIGPNVRFGFHGPSAKWPGIALPPKTFQHWSVRMADHYPPEIRDWYLKTARYRIVGFYFLSGKMLLKFGYKECKTER